MTHKMHLLHYVYLPLIFCVTHILYNAHHVYLPLYIYFITHLLYKKANKYNAYLPSCFPFLIHFLHITFPPLSCLYHAYFECLVHTSLQ